MKDLPFDDELVESALRPLRENLFELPWADEDFYRNFLIQSYYILSSFGRLLEQLGEPCRRRGGGDWQDFYAQIRRECGRADLAYRDFLQMGGVPEESPQSALSRALWETQSYKMLEQPSAGLGFIFALEKFASLRSAELPELVKNVYGEDAGSFVLIQSETSLYLAEACWGRIRQLPAEEAPAVCLNFQQTCSMLQFFLLSCRGDEGFWNHKPILLLLAEA